MRRLKQLHDLPGVSENNSHSTIVILTFSVFVCAFLYIWFHQIQEYAFSHGMHQVLFSDEGYFGILFDSIVRMISHIDKGHLLNNLIAVLFFAVIFSLRQETGFFIFQLLVLVTGNIIIFTHYTTVVGLSFLTSGLFTISLYFTLKWLFSIIKENKKMTLKIVNVYLLLLILLDYGKYIIIDFLIAARVITIENPGYVTYLTNPHHENYTIESAEIHLIGFTLGALIVTFHMLQNSTKT